jgi:hypothetical protein
MFLISIIKYKLNICFNYAMVKKLYIKNIKEINNKLISILIEKKEKKKKRKI